MSGVRIIEHNKAIDSILDNLSKAAKPEEFKHNDQPIMIWLVKQLHTMLSNPEQAFLLEHYQRTIFNTLFRIPFYKRTLLINARDKENNSAVDYIFCKLELNPQLIAWFLYLHHNASESHHFNDQTLYALVRAFDKALLLEQSSGKKEILATIELTIKSIVLHYRIQLLMNEHDQLPLQAIREQTQCSPEAESFLVNSVGLANDNHMQDCLEKLVYFNFPHFDVNQALKLARCGANPNNLATTMITKTTLLHLIAEHADEQSFEFAMTALVNGLNGVTKVAVNAKNVAGKTPLECMMDSPYFNCLRAVKLVTLGANLPSNFLINLAKNSEKPHFRNAIVQLLSNLNARHKIRASINNRDASKQMTALQFILNKKPVDNQLVTLLLEAGANHQDTDRAGLSAAAIIGKTVNNQSVNASESSNASLLGKFSVINTLKSFVGGEKKPNESTPLIRQPK